MLKAGADVHRELSRWVPTLSMGVDPKTAVGPSDLSAHQATTAGLRPQRCLASVPTSQQLDLPS